MWIHVIQYKEVYAYNLYSAVILLIEEMCRWLSEPTVAASLDAMCSSQQLKVLLQLLKTGARERLL